MTTVDHYFPCIFSGMYSQFSFDRLKSNPREKTAWALSVRITIEKQFLKDLQQVSFIYGLVFKKK